MTSDEYNQKIANKSSYAHVIRSSPYFSEYTKWKESKGINGGLTSSGYLGGGDISYSTDQNDFDWYNQFAQETGRPVLSLETVPGGGFYKASDNAWTQFLNTYWSKYK